MAWIVGDSFDYYGAVADLARSVWDSYAAANVLVSGASTRFGVGQAFKPSSTAVYLTKNIPTNESTIYCALAYYRPGALSGTSPELYLTFRDGATAQCTVVFESSGSIVLKSGLSTGTVLATYPAAFAQDVWTHFQVRVVIDGAAGSMTVRKNGQTTDTYASATTLNTRGGTANNYATVIALGEGTGPALWFLDDVLFFSASGAAPNTWVGDVRAVCLAPAADTAQKQFASLSVTGTTTTGTTSSAATVVQNTVRYIAYVPARSGTITNATVTYSANLTGSAQVAIYADAGGVPGALLGASAVVVNPVTGVNNFAFAAGPSLAQGRPYWFAYNDTIAAGHILTGIAAGTAYYQLQTFASGFPNPATALVGAGPGGTGLATFSTLTLSGNVSQVSEALANGDTDYVFDATVGDADLYDMDDLPTTPASVLGVVSKIFVKKSDAGARQGQVLLSSGGTQVAGTDTVLGTTYTYLARVDTVDPATGVAWTPAAVNAVKIGQKVTA